MFCGKNRCMIITEAFISLPLFFSILILLILPFQKVFLKVNIFFSLNQTRLIFSVAS